MLNDISGKFAFNRTGNPFSSLPVDQAHECNNAILKCKNPVVGLGHDAANFTRVTLAGPEVARIMKEFRAGEQPARLAHHEEYMAFQKTFKRNVSALKTSFLNFCNPFLEVGPDLIALDTRETVCLEGVKALFSLEASAKEKYTEFVGKRIRSQEASLYQSILKSSIQIFALKKKALHQSKDQAKISMLKEEITVFWRLYVTALIRKLDLNQFFAYENQRYPPALTQQGVMRTAPKSDLVQILESLLTSRGEPTICDCLVVDGASLVHQVRVQ